MIIARLYNSSRLCNKPSPQMYLIRYHKPSPSEFLVHYGVKGMKWGVRRTPEQLGHHQKTVVENPEPSAIIRTTISGHVPIPKQGIPNSILDHIGTDGKVDSRSFYDRTGMKVMDIHTTNHGHPKQHPVVPHAHDYSWDEDTGKLDRTTRELTETERKENEDIL